MGRYLVRAGIEAALTIAGLLFFSFFILKLLPGSPFDDEVSLHPTVRLRLEESWGLNRPVWQQLFYYSKSALSGDFGDSISEPGRKVSEILAMGLRSSLPLNTIALLVVFVLGFVWAAIVVLSEGTWLQALIELMLTAFVSLPSLFLGPLLIYFFCYRWDFLPATQLNQISSYLLPVLALSLRPAAYLARILSSTWIKQTRAEYMKTALAKGLSHRRAVFIHAFRNSLIPVVNYSGPLVLHLLSGSFLVELLFVIPGLGTTFVHAIGHRDYPVIIGITLFSGLALVMISFTIDLINQQLDPRWRK